MPLINTGRIEKENKMKREHHERKDRTAKRSDRREERQKGGVLHREQVPRSFALLKA